MSTVIFYSSMTGNSEEIASKISGELGNIEIKDLAKTNIDEINDFDKVILGASTWGFGELNDEWDESWEKFKKIDFSGKTVALFGLGDQESYGDTFCDAVGMIYEQVIKTQGEIIGFTSCEGYEFNESKAKVDGKFVGLIIDEDNQGELTNKRINEWCKDIKDKIL